VTATAWFDERAAMDPQQLLTATFPVTRPGRRGYEKESVRAFLHAVHADYLRLLNERTSLWQDLQRLRRRIIAGQADAAFDRVLAREAGGHAHAVRVLSAAQFTAHQYVADAQAYSSKLTEEARQRRDEIMHEVQRYSDRALEEAHAKAREAAVSVLDTAPSPQADHEEQAAQAELAYLRTYSDVYRAHLRAYTEGILQGIEDWAGKEAASFGDTEHGIPVTVLPATDGTSSNH
jgi:cell division septum initiation protein DivIVA